MPKAKITASKKASNAPETFNRIGRTISLVAQVELALRSAIHENRFPNGKLPSEVELAEQLGVGRETVRLAAEVLQREGLLFKVRRRGTFTKPPCVPEQINKIESKLFGYLQADFTESKGQEELANRAISGLIMHGALSEAGVAGFRLEAHHTSHVGLREAVQHLCENARLRGLLIVSYSEDKMLRRLTARNLPVVLVDEDTKVPNVNTVRDDSFEGARQAVLHLAGLGHQRIAYAHWNRDDINRWRPMGYHRGMQDAGLRRMKKWELLTELTPPGARKLVDRFLGIATPPSALYCFNNTLAGIVISEFKKRGIRVPEDVSVMGAGGEEIHGLTCHQVDWNEMGRIAIQILFRAIADPEHHVPEHQLCKHTIRLGKTTAAPSA
ncbi:MAG: GntR family transcriptional regulator [Pirellula sp.]